jgi:cytochrome P450
MATAVIAEVVGLTEGPLPEMTVRLDQILNANLDTGLDIRRLPRLLKLNRLMADFMQSDVHPAVTARKAEPREDVITHLISQGRNDEEILIECITYGAAGMVTTQEFICVAAWHMLENPDIKQHYLESETGERITILNELLRLEPVVGRLTRRAASELTIESRGQVVCIPAGALIDLHVFEINRDAAAVGEDPLDFNPQRKTERGVTESAMSFGAGPHRCIGEHLALAETDTFLTRLFALPGLHTVQEPRLERSSLTKSYKLREFMVAID